MDACGCLCVVVTRMLCMCLIADDTSILFTHSNFMEFHVNIETVLRNVNTWLKNRLSLNTEKNLLHTLQDKEQPTH